MYQLSEEHVLNLIKQAYLYGKLSMVDTNPMPYEDMVKELIEPVQKDAEHIKGMEKLRYIG